MLNKNLVISNYSYDWVEYCYGLITKSNDIFEIMIFEDDSHRPIYNFEKLCKKAVVEQRKQDLYNLGKSLNIQKLYTFNYKSHTDITRLISTLQLSILIGGVKTIYLQYNPIIIDVLKELCTKFKINLYLYGNCDSMEQYKEIKLTRYECKKKYDICSLIVGGYKKYSINCFLDKNETFYTV